MLGLSHTATSARTVPDVAGVRLGRTSNAVIATLKSEGSAVTRTFFTPCLRDDLARAAGKASATGPGRCVQSLNARFAGGDLLIWFVEGLPKQPGSSVATTISVNYPTDAAAVESLVQRAGPPSLTDGNDPWVIAMWCFDFVCTEMNHVLADPSSGATLLVHRYSGFTLQDARIRTSRVPDFRRPLAGDPRVNYGPTPRQAAMHILMTFKGAPLVFERVNVAGRYATVLSNGEVMPGGADHEPILFERFSFGWQPLIWLSRCDLDGRAISARDQELLVRGMPKPADGRPCTDLRTGDAGPPAAVEAVRRLRHERFVPSVMVAGNFALVQWMNGPGGGQALYRKRSGRWDLIAGGGGALNADDLRALAAPQAALCVFRAYGADCSRKR
jgi:hypothetical protein